jgi:hypothetical protein
MEHTNKINVQADGYRLTPDWAVVGTEGSYGVSTLAFEFDKAWDGLMRRATFYPADGSQPIEVLVSDGEVAVPAEVTAAAGTAEYVLDGTRDGVRLISLCGRLRVLQTKGAGGDDSAGASEDAYAQLVALIQTGAMRGKSAYEVAVDNGFEGSEQEWLAELHGYLLTEQDRADIANIVAAKFIDASEVAM